MQDHRQAVALRQPQLLAVEAPLALAHLWRAELRHEEVEPDLADRDQARVAGAAFELVGQRLQIGIARARHEQRMDAERVGVAGALRELPHTVEVGRLHRRIDAQVHAERARQCPLLQARCAIRAEFGRVEVAMGVDPHAAIVLHPCRTEVLRMRSTLWWGRRMLVA